MDSLPPYVPLVFGLTLLLALLLFYRATRSAKGFLLVAGLWTAAQAALSLAHFYENPAGWPPRFALLLGPPLALTVGLFATRRGRRFVDGLDGKWLTLFHVVRGPVEWALFALFVHGAVPRLMTFEGRNFDLISGLTAPAVYYFGFVRPRLGRAALLAWNVACLALVANIAVNGVLSAPGPLQRFAFAQPNVAVLHFPFALLPGVLVPLVLVAHLAAIRQLLRNQMALPPRPAELGSAAR